MSSLPPVPRPPVSRLEHWYASALRLYPGHFQTAYSEAMQQAFRDALQDRSVRRRMLLATILSDLVTSLAKENLAMMRDTFARPAVLFNAIILSALATGLALALYAIPQQVLRQGANDPQIALAGDLVEKLESGVAPLDAVPSNAIDMARSLTPFVIVYDDQGRPIASQAELNRETPAPPMGVFANVRQNGESRISWQPVRGRERGLRIAAVVRRVTGQHAGFVLAGRSLREVEAREQQVSQMAGLTWIGMLGVIFIGSIAFGWYTRPRVTYPIRHAILYP
jgi:hypothetical protein